MTSDLITYAPGPIYVALVLVGWVWLRRFRAARGLPEYGPASKVADDLVGAGAAFVTLIYALALRPWAFVVAIAIAAFWVGQAVRHGMRVHGNPSERPRFGWPWVHLCALDRECLQDVAYERLYIHPLRIYIDFEDAETTTNARRAHP